MGGSRHKIPAIANRLRLNRGFDSVWYAGPADYARMLQRDWLLTKNAWSFVQRCSRSSPKIAGRDEQAAAAAAKAAADPTRPRYPAKPQPQQQDVRDFPNFRPARVFTAHLPYKSCVNVFAYTAPRTGPQVSWRSRGQGSGLWGSGFRGRGGGGSRGPPLGLGNPKCVRVCVFFFGGGRGRGREGLLG